MTDHLGDRYGSRLYVRLYIFNLSRPNSIYMYTLPTGSRRAVSPGASAAAAVCCMCGDQGLPDELFQCAVCLQRLQHRYCSDQYPRMAAYSTCNWCLRDKEVGDGSPSPAAAKALTAARAKQRVASSRLNGSRAHHHDDKDRPCGGGSGGCSSRSAFPAEPQKPVKKTKKSHERAARRPAAAPLGKATEAQTGGARTNPPFRAKARVPRYKLLTEVIRCK